MNASKKKETLVRGGNIGLHREKDTLFPPEG